MEGWPERFNLFPRLTRVAQFLGGPVVHESYSPHFRKVDWPYDDSTNEVELVGGLSESEVGHLVAIGEMTPEQALIALGS